MRLHSSRSARGEGRVRLQDSLRLVGRGVQYLGRSNSKYQDGEEGHLRKTVALVQS